MRVDWIDAIMITIMAVFFIGIAYLMYTSEKRWAECRERGGIVLKADGGYVCAKVERI